MEGTVASPVPTAPMSAAPVPAGQAGPPSARPAPPLLERALAALPTTPPAILPGQENKVFTQTYLPSHSPITKPFYQQPSPSQNIRVAAQNSLERAIAASPQTPPSLPSSMNRTPLFARQTSLPNKTIVTPQGIWQNVSSPSVAEHTLPAVQNFIQLAFQTVQQAKQPHLATTPLNRAFPPALVVTPRSPQTSLPPPFPSLQKGQFATQEPPKTESTPKQMTTEKINGLTQNKSDTSIDKNNQPATCKSQAYYPPPHYTMYQSALARPGKSRQQAKSPKKAQTPAADLSSPSKRPMLVARRRSSPKPEQESKTQSPAKSTAVDKTQSPKSQVPKGSPSTKNSPVKQNLSRVAQSFKEYQKEREQREQAAPGQGQGSAGSSSGKQSWRRATSLEEEEEIDPKKRVLVSGFPAYTQSYDLSRVMSSFGTCQVDSCRNRLAVVTFENETQAKNAIKSTDDIKIFGEYIEIRPYTNPRHVDELYKAYKKVLTVQKGQEITMPDKIDLTGDFYSQMSAIQNAIRLSPEEAHAVNNLYNDLELVLQQEWPGCVAIPFGSIPTGLGIKSSDADCYVELPSRFKPRAGAATHFVTRARRLLQQYPQVFTHLIAIPRANTPIVKFRHEPSGFHCDVSAKTPLGAQNSKLIKLLFEHDVRLQRVAVLIKYWAKVHDLSGTGRLTNYALTMMVIFYLQQTEVPFLPPVEKLQTDHDTRYIVDYWNAGFSNKKLPVVAKEKTIPHIFGGFFEFYEKFNFETEVVCPFLGRPVKKDAFDSLTTLPLEFSRYIGNVEDNLASPIRHWTSFCVQDPFEQSHNVASSVGKKLANDIRAYIKFAAEAYRKDQEHRCHNFLRTILRTKPELRPARPPASSMLRLIPRVRGEISHPDWQKCLREILVDTIFKEILRLPLELAPVDEKDVTRRKKTREKYCGCATRPVWQRQKLVSLGVPLPDAQQVLISQQAAVTDQLLAREDNSIQLKFELELWYKDTPRTFEVSLRMVDGDLDQFRHFVMFLHTSVLNWFRVLLRPHQAPLNEPPEVTVMTDAAENTLAQRECNIKIETDETQPEEQQVVNNVTDQLETVSLDTADILDTSQAVSQ